MAVNREIRFTFIADTKKLDKAFDLEKAKLNHIKASTKEQAKQEMENALLTLKNSKLKGKAYDDELLKIRRAYREKINQINYASEVERALLKSDKKAKAEQIKEETRIEKQALKEQEKAQKDKIQSVKKLLNKFNINISDEQASQLANIGAMAGKLAIVVGIVSALSKAYKKVSKFLNDISTKIRTTLYKAISKSIQGMINLFSTLYDLLTRVVEKLYELAEYGGDLQAANNMVAASFGNMTDELDGFVNAAKESYGLTETMAKKTAGLFMSMSNSMGIARKEGEQMALSLAALSGDMASFYNANQKDIMLALKSVYTGETETLKNYAIVLTEANLKQYMLEKGIKASYQEMTQAEKTLLRYNYVMEATTAVQGNFVRTGDSYVTTLAGIKAELGTLLELLGKVAIQLLTPMLKVISTIIAHLQVMAQVLSDCLEKMFGLVAISGIMGGDISLIDWDGEEEQAGKTIEGIKSKLSTLAGVDTINVLQEPSSSSSGGGLGDIETYTRLKEILEEVSNYKKKIEEKVDPSKYKWVETLMQWIKDRITNAKTSFKNAFAGVDLEPLKKAWGNFGEKLGPFLDKMIEYLAIASAWFVEHILPHLLDIAAILMEIIPLIIEAIDWEWLGGIIEDTLKFVSEKLKEFKTWCEENPDKLSEIVNWIIKIVGFIAFILPLLLGIAPIIIGIISLITILATIALPAVVAALVMVGVMAVMYLSSKFGEACGKAILFIINLAKEIIAKIANAFSIVAQVVELAIQICFAKLQQFGQNIISAFQFVAQAIANLFNSIPDMIAAGLNLAIKMINTVLQMLNNLQFDIPDWVPELGGKSFGFNIPEIPQLQSGGVFSQPNITQTSGRPSGRTATSHNSEYGDNSGYFNEMISLLQSIANKDNNTYIDGRQLNKMMNNTNNKENWRRNATT